MSLYNVIARRLAAVLLMGTAALPLYPSSQSSTANDPLPIIFVHGNGDDASKWIGVIWLFESNGYPSDRLFSIRFPLPTARTDDTREEPFRSSTIDSAAELSAFVTRVLLQTHSKQVALVGSSRGGLTIRNYILNGGGAANVAYAVLAGTPNHGVLASDTNLNGEFNGKGHFLQSLNSANSDGSEVVSGVRFLTLRSDKLDKYAQPTGVAFGTPQTTTGVGFDGPALRGASNIVLPNLDHRELAFQPTAFAQMYRFIASNTPHTLTITPEAAPTISGVVTGFAGIAPTNLPLTGVHLHIYPVDSSKTLEHVDPVYEITTKDDGKWGPFQANAKQEYEFDLEYQGRHVRYYKAPIPRSTNLLNLRFAPVPRDQATLTTSATIQHTSQLLIARPQGYFSRDRDPVRIDGKAPIEEPSGLPIRDSFTVSLPETAPTTITLRDETIVATPSDDLTKDLPIVDFLW